MIVRIDREEKYNSVPFPEAIYDEGVEFKTLLESDDPLIENFVHCYVMDNNLPHDSVEAYYNRFNIRNSKAVYKASNVDDSSYVQSSHDIYHSTGIVRSVNVHYSDAVVDSSNVWRSRAILDSIDVTACVKITGCDTSTECEACKECNNIQYSSYCSYCNDAEDLHYSRMCSDAESCYFCSECSDTSFSLFSTLLHGVEDYIFNQPVTAEMYEYYADELKELLTDYPVEVDGDNYILAPEVIDFIRTLPGYTWPVAFDLTHDTQFINLEN